MKKYTVKQIKSICLPLLMMIIQAPAFSQQFSEAITELQKIQQAYSDTGYNSFSVKYQYSKISAPAKVLDTLSFQYKIKGGKYYCSVDNIEFLQNDSVNIAVYHGEKTIILSNPSVNLDKGRMAIDNWDSAFVASNIDSVYVADNKDTRTISFHFTPASRYSSCSISYNSNTYRPKKISYTEKGSQYYEDGNDKPDGIIITMSFSPISKSPFNESVYSEKKFVNLQNDKWTISSNYNGYNLVNNFYKTE